MKDETRDQLERVRGSLSRTDYIEGAVLAQIARDLKKTEAPHPGDIIRNNLAVAMPSGEVVIGGEELLSEGHVHFRMPSAEATFPFPTTPNVRSSAESKAGVLPVPKKAQKGRK